MFTVGLDVDTRSYFSAATLLIALPTSIKVFSWLVGLRRSTYAPTTTWYIISFLLMFLLGGVTGLVLANSELDMVLHDTYFVVAHFHYVLSLGAVFGLLVGLVSTHELLVGYRLSLWLARVQVLVLLAGTTCVFWGMHLSGSMGLPRRMPDAPDTYMHMAVATSWGLGVVVVGLSLLVITSLETTAWEIAVERPSVHPTAIGAHQVLTPTHSMDQCTRGMFMLHTTTCTSTRSAMHVE